MARRKEKTKEDWERCRDWLKDERVTPASAKIPSLEQLTEEYDLYTYLKDGTELCRIIGILTKGEVPEGILYRTNSVSTLEEKNVKKFIEIVRETYKIKDVFGKTGEKIFKDFKQFYKVLEGLAEVSLKVEKDKGIIGFEKKEKAQVSRYEEAEERHKINEIYMAAGKNEDEQEYADNIYSTYIDFSKVTDLDEAINELIKVNQSYIIRVLKNVKENFIDQAEMQTHGESTILLDRFFPLFRIEELLELHKSLDDELSSLNHSYHQIGPIFEKYRDQFLIYCDISANVKTAGVFLADQMSNNLEIRDQVKSLQAVAESKNKSRNDNKLTFNLKDLMLMLLQHLMRYPMMIGEILKFAEKENRNKVVKHSRKAMELMDNLVKHVDKYEQDSNYIETMNHLAEELKDVDFVHLHHFGILVREVDEIDMKIVTDDSFRSFNMLCFDQALVFSSLHEQDEYVGKHSIWGTPQYRKHKVKRFFKDFRLRDYDEIRTTPNQQQKYYAIHLKAFDKKAKDNREKSITLRVNDGDYARILSDKLEELRRKAKKQMDAGNQHKGHKCKPYRNEIDEEKWNHEKCADCKKYLLGKIQTGIKCATCKALYHEECFKSDKAPDDATDEDEDTSLYFTSMDEFFVGKKTTQEAELELRNKKKGAFLVRFSDKSHKHVLSIKTNKDKNGTNSEKTKFMHYHINEEDDGGQKFYWIYVGDAMPSILECINNHRNELDLQYGIFSLDALASDEELQLSTPTPLSCPSVTPSPRASATPEFKENPYEMFDKDGNIRPKSSTTEYIPHSSYYHGELSSEDADQILLGQPSGTFLLRWNNGGLRITRVTEDSRQKQDTRHYKIHEDKDKKVSFSKNKKFGSIEELVAHYQSQESSRKYWLGDPLYTASFEAEQKVKNSPVNVTDEELLLRRMSSKKKEPYSLSYFHGTMSGKEADIKLRAEPSGTFLLRKNENQEYRISLKNGKSVQHVVINSDGNNFFTSKDAPFTSLRRLVTNLRENEDLLTTPLRSEILWNSMVSTQRESAESRRAELRPTFVPKTSIVEEPEQQESRNDDTSGEESNQGQEENSTVLDKRYLVPRSPIGIRPGTQQWNELRARERNLSKINKKKNTVETPLIRYGTEDDNEDHLYDNIDDANESSHEERDNQQEEQENEEVESDENLYFDNFQSEDEDENNVSEEHEEGNNNHNEDQEINETEEDDESSANKLVDETPTPPNEEVPKQKRPYLDIKAINQLVQAKKLAQSKKEQTKLSTQAGPSVTPSSRPKFPRNKKEQENQPQSISQGKVSELSMKIQKHDKEASKPIPLARTSKSFKKITHNRLVNQGTFDDDDMESEKPSKETSVSQTTMRKPSVLKKVPAIPGHLRTPSSRGTSQKAPAIPSRRKTTEIPPSLHTERKHSPKLSRAIERKSSLNSVEEDRNKDRPGISSTLSKIRTLPHFGIKRQDSYKSYTDRGYLEGKDAERMMKSCKEGTWILRKNAAGEYRITVKKETGKNIHIMLTEYPDQRFTPNELTELPDTMENVIKNLKDSGEIKKEFKS